MRGLLVTTLLSSAICINAHANHNHRRGLNIDEYRNSVGSTYTHVEKANAADAPKVKKRDNYVDTATDLVKKIHPAATFRLIEDHYVGDNGIAHVHFKQTVNGLDVDNGDFSVNIGKDGNVWSYGNSFFDGPLPTENPLAKRGYIDPSAALQGVIDNLRLSIEINAAVMEASIDNDEAYTFSGATGAYHDPKARLVYYQKDGNIIPSWKVETDVLHNWLVTYVDSSESSNILGVVDWTEDASYEVYPWGLNDPTEGARKIISDPWDLTSSEFTWQGDGTSNFTSTRGNNGIAQYNPTGGKTEWENLPRPEDAGTDFAYPFSLNETDPSKYVNASVTQLFYTANRYHDLLHTLGFTEKAGNFEWNNNEQGGKGRDYVILNTQDGSGTNNAAFQTPGDGQPGRMFMFIWTNTPVKRDSSFDAGVVIHEYTHGVSNRLTGGSAQANCLTLFESRAMGEGWGDFMATAIRVKDKDTRETNYPMGAWISGKPNGIRKFPYSTDLKTNSHFYTDANNISTASPHPVGTIWATMLNEVMWNLIDKHGNNAADTPTFKDGVPTDGRYLAMKLVVDGMALQPCNPNFVQARDAILDADKALTKGANQCEIWKGFAKRGLGEGAKYSPTARVGSTYIPNGVCNSTLTITRKAKRYEKTRRWYA